MKNPTQRDIAYYTSGWSAAITAVALFVLKLSLPDSLHWAYVLAVPALVFLSCYLLVLNTVERFIYRKIKVLYKTIHTMKTGQVARELLDSEANVLETVEQEVKDYGERQSAEIAQLKQHEQYRKEFLGNVSHELKTPIFNIQGYVQTLLDGGLEDSKVNVGYLIKASKNVDRLNNIVQDLMLISQFESGKLLLDIESFDIKELVQEQLEQLEMQADLQEIELRFKKTVSKGILVKADRKQIGLVLTNLLSNAIKYGSEGGHVDVGFYDLDERVLVEVSDDGPGIPQSHLPRLFERFYRIDSSRSRESGGTGLGLAIVKHIIEAHDQTVNVRSEIDKGTTFAFTLTKAH